jgi:hypothetical protein
MQEKSIFLAKIQQVKQGKIRKRWGLTEEGGVIAWNYEENSNGLGVFFETPVGGALLVKLDENSELAGR